MHSVKLKSKIRKIRLHKILWITHVDQPLQSCKSECHSAGTGYGVWKGPVSKIKWEKFSFYDNRPHFNFA